MALVPTDPWTLEVEDESGKSHLYQQQPQPLVPPAERWALPTVSDA